ncbi:hypothetical protein SLEP1_g20014 [Rubroshorea leprosula]|uniref:Carboxypeptidase n=1 Tax=Rubroshorea leprosula TaxID=152421 RepID=A0AAV5JD89_9ROSI|nr:hypothetical protein SLEP1_g20014 [Rubroshorea leprosula]
MASFSPLKFLAILLVLLVSPLSSARYHSGQNTHDVSSSTAYSLAKKQAERLIKSFNLSPKDSVSTIHADTTASKSEDAPGIVEKQFKFPSVSGPGPSVQEFGHYAGYYKLQHSKAARIKFIPYSFLENQVIMELSLCIFFSSETGGENACISSYQTCNGIFHQILSYAGNINYYDIRKQCEGSLCYDFSAMETFLNEKSVKDALGVGDISFVSCSTDVYYEMTGDWMRNLAIGIPELLEDGIRVLLYEGEYDLICNWLGNSLWVNALEWSGQKEYQAAPTVPFVVDGKEAGRLKTHGALSFLKVHNAGHMVPMDQPKNSLQMLESWMQGKLAMQASILDEI